MESLRYKLSLLSRCKDVAKIVLCRGNRKRMLWASFLVAINALAAPLGFDFARLRVAMTCAALQ